jgi:hypothetical protein
LSHAPVPVYVPFCHVLYMFSLWSVISCLPFPKQVSQIPSLFTRILPNSCPLTMCLRSGLVHRWEPLSLRKITLLGSHCYQMLKLEFELKQLVSVVLGAHWVLGARHLAKC